jgi:hypothetical protein
MLRNGAGIGEINAGNFPFAMNDPELQTVVKRGCDAGNLSATADAAAGNWSAKIEYNFVDLGTQTELFPMVTTSIPAFNGLLNTFNISQQVHLIKFGINYRFGY